MANDNAGIINQLLLYTLNYFPKTLMITLNIELVNHMINIIVESEEVGNIRRKNNLNTKRRLRLYWHLDHILVFIHKILLK